MYVCITSSFLCRRLSAAGQGPGCSCRSLGAGTDNSSSGERHNPGLRESSWGQRRASVPWQSWLIKTNLWTAPTDKLTYLTQRTQTMEVFPMLLRMQSKLFFKKYCRTTRWAWLGIHFVNQERVEWPNSLLYFQYRHIAGCYHNIL